MESITLSQFSLAFALTLFAGLSTAVGALLAFFSHAKNYTLLSVGMGFSAGVMIYVSFAEILLKSKNAFGTLLEIPSMENLWHCCASLLG